ncbi:DUF3558 domain-containing protein [Saccharopolyspora rosea]|uniref:DUF3558 domain-containing protein n=1 Tax=Saccharopolyspora rosea TaxID=524884 RepID=UPI0021D975EC|nr:DUF3558 domain-containing protein [Saccharopolyspora rosea]
MRSRSVITAVTAAALLGLSACGGAGDSGAEQPEPQAKPLQSFDACTFFTPEELTSFGVETKAEDFTQVGFQPGCKWNGDQMILSLQKNVDEDFDQYEKTGTFDEFTRKPFAGRAGARMLTAGAKGQGVCNAVVSAGGGIVLYQVTGNYPEFDACGEVEKIADQTAARLPQ